MALKVTDFKLKWIITCCSPRVVCECVIADEAFVVKFQIIVFKRFVEDGIRTVWRTQYEVNALDVIAAKCVTDIYCELHSAEFRAVVW